jgi:hypothetical protein
MTRDSHGRAPATSQQRPGFGSRRGIAISAVPTHGRDGFGYTWFSALGPGAHDATVRACVRPSVAPSRRASGPGEAQVIPRRAAVLARRLKERKLAHWGIAYRSGSIPASVPVAALPFVNMLEHDPRLDQLTASPAFAGLRP